MKDKYSTLIKVTWVVLICCFIVKLLGGNFFEIACNNEKFVSFCNLIPFGSIGSYIVLYLGNMISTTIVLLAILKIKNPFANKKIFYTIIILVTGVFVFKFFNEIKIKHLYLNFVLDLFLTIVVPIIFDKNKWKKAIAVTIYILLFQVISLITKNIGFKRVDTNLFIYLIYMLDYYIMVILYYLYSIKEDENNVRWFIFLRNRKRRNDNSNS